MEKKRMLTNKRMFTNKYMLTNKRETNKRIRKISLTIVKLEVILTVSCHVETTYNLNHISLVFLEGSR